MIRPLPARVIAHLAALLACIVAGKCDDVRAQGKLEARYAIWMTGISIGEGELNADIGQEQYSASAAGNASGLAAVLVKGKGSIASRGAIKDGNLLPANFTSDITRDDEKSELKMTLEAGVVKELVVNEPPAKDERVPVTEAHRRGITDPLAAVLIAAGGAGNVPAPEACNRTLPIFDGRRRFDLVLSFKRMDRVAADKGYQGPAVVCNVVLKPIAGHRAESLIVKYVAGNRDMEIWFAPIAGTRLIAPFRVSIRTVVGTLLVKAKQF